MDRGGAANSCIRLHQGLLVCNAQSKLLIKYKSEQSSNIAECYQFINSNNRYLHLPLRLASKLLKIIRQKDPVLFNKKYLSTRPKALELFSFPYSESDITKSPLYKEADIINLHWVTQFLDYPSFFKKVKKPVVWTLHDMDPFLGGEHYSEQYLGIDGNGKPIARKISDKEKKIFKMIIGIKKDCLKNIENLCVVCPSKWLQNEAQNSEVLGRFKVHHIPYGFDSNIYKTMNRNFSREFLGISQDADVVLFVADSNQRFRKGFGFLLKALENLKNKNILLCFVGKKDSNVKYDIPVLEIGHVKDERFLSLIYSAADVFIIPSIEDNLPNTAIESLLCGTPVIGFSTGGIPEIVRHGINGYICSEKSTTALSNTISVFLSSRFNFNAEAIRKDALSKYDLKIQAKAYIELYQSIINNSQ